MAGRALTFFFRQTLTGATIYYSSQFDISQYASLTLRLEAFGVLGTNPTVDVAVMVSDTLDIPMTNWDAVENFTQVSSPTGETKTLADMRRYVALRVTLGGTDPITTLQLTGVARTDG